MDAEILKARTKIFAKDCLRLLNAESQRNKLFWHIEGQLIRCSTSVACNYRAACLAQSRAAFTAKISIVLEEADESVFWLEMLEEECNINTAQIKNIKAEGAELTRIFASTRKRLQTSSKS